jgi:hypothetical protein
MHPFMPVIADADEGSIFLVCAVLLAVVGLGAWGAIALRRRLWGEEEGGSESPEGFTLGELRQLRKTGHLTDEEFEKAKAMVVAAAQHRANSPQDAKKPGKST